ncbi:MAG: VanZ family protein [Nitrospirota bacterium]
MASFHYPRLWHTLGWLLVVLVVFLSLTPKAPVVLEVPGSDKVNHVVAYLVMMLWFSQLHREPRRQFWIGVGLIALGAGLELAQGLLMYRSADPLDGLANGCGVFAGRFLVETRLGSSLAFFDSQLLRLTRRR